MSVSSVVLSRLYTTVAAAGRPATLVTQYCGNFSSGVWPARWPRPAPSLPAAPFFHWAVVDRSALLSPTRRLSSRWTLSRPDTLRLVHGPALSRDQSDCQRRPCIERRGRWKIDHEIPLSPATKNH